MKLQIHQINKNEHNHMVTACCWTPTNEIITCSDDHQILRWQMDGEFIGVITKLDGYVTAIDWIPSIGKQKAEIFAVSCTDGSFRLLSKSGREEKKIQSSEKGAIITLKWNHDGSAISTGSEDGSVKIWSRSGNLRSTIAQTGRSIYTLAWGPDNDQLLFSSGSELVIKTIQVGKKQLAWKAHDGVVMKVDWNPINNRIISGGEDRIFRIWDSFGRQLYQSSPCTYVITSISWSPNGETFVIGAYNMLRLCDKTGWSYCHEQPSSGSLMDLSWSSDGTHLAGAGGNNSVLFSQIIDRTLEWNNIRVTLIDPKRIIINDIVNEQAEELEFERDRVIDFRLGYNYFIAVTCSQCFIYNIENWNTPHIFDLRVTPHFILQGEKYFLLADYLNGIKIYSYEGRVISNPKFNGLQVELLHPKTISMSIDTISILDRSNGSRTIRNFDILSGKSLGSSLGTIEHSLEILEFSFNHYGTSRNERKILFIDSNNDLYITPLLSANLKNYKLCSQVTTASWNNSSDQLVAISDGKLITWSYPSMIYVDKALLPLTCTKKDGTDYQKFPRIISYTGSHVTIRRIDGAVLTTSVSPYTTLLYSFAKQSKWEEAIRLCRFVKSNELWACLAGMAITSRHLDTAEIALASVEEIDKLNFILYIKSIPSEEGRNAELALYQHNYDEAESILLQAQPNPLVYRAIKMNLRLFRWSRALELAIKYKTHVDTVLGYRDEYLKFNDIKENNKRFLQYSEQVDIDWEAINAKKKIEYEKEKERNYNSSRK